MLAQDSLAQIEVEATKYPADKRASTLMAALTIAQNEKGYLSGELIEYIADVVGVPSMRAFEVATFYSMYDHEPRGETQIKVCTNISCMLRGSNEIVKQLEQGLGIKLGEVSEDGKVGLKEVECLGACVGAPMLQMNNGEFIEHLDTEKIDGLIKQVLGGEG